MRDFARWQELAEEQGYTIEQPTMNHPDCFYILLRGEIITTVSIYLLDCVYQLTTEQEARKFLIALRLQHAQLTTREQQILTLVCDGMSNQKIANMLHVPSQTIDTFVRRIKRKTGVRYRHELQKLHR